MEPQHLPGRVAVKIKYCKAGAHSRSSVPPTLPGIMGEVCGHGAIIITPQVEPSSHRNEGRPVCVSAVKDQRLIAHHRVKEMEGVGGP